MVEAGQRQARCVPGTGVARTVSSQSPIDVEFSPFFSMHRRTYAAYWDVLTPAELTVRARELTA